MSIKNQDNLDKLLSTFMNSDSAGKAAENFRQADLIFEKYNSAAEPDSKLLANIKADIGRELNHSKASIVKTATLRFAAAAAVFLIAASVFFMMNQNDPQPPKNQAVAMVTDSASTESIWDSEDVTANDAQYETFEQEIEQLEAEIVAIKYETDSTINGESELTEIENDLIEIQSNFWKG
ncbi:MAG: hypothetical protein KAS96_12330 [Planctomycetes bacterium]|nr:hypothetical protein [Planctomycetota bacterium]